MSQVQQTYANSGMMKCQAANKKKVAKTYNPVVKGRSSQGCCSKLLKNCCPNPNSLPKPKTEAEKQRGYVTILTISNRLKRLSGASEDTSGAKTWHK